MTSRFSTPTRFMAAFTAALVVALTASVSALDAGIVEGDPVFESAHDRAHCGVGHDHTVCTQASAERPMPTAGAQLDPADAAALRRASPALHAVPAGHAASAHRSRAPPPAHG